MEKKAKIPQVTYAEERALFAQACRDAMIKRYGRVLTTAELAEKARQAEAELVIDVTGTPLSPGDPQNCLGGDNHPEYPLCCDECDYMADCYPEFWPKEIEEGED